MLSFFRLWISKLPRVSPIIKNRPLNGTGPFLPREIIEKILCVLVYDYYDPFGKSESSHAQTHTISHVLLIDHASHQIVRRALRTGKEDDRNPYPRAPRIVEAALLNVLFAEPNDALFHQFQEALMRWWPTGNSKTIYIDTTYRVVKLYRKAKWPLFMHPPSADPIRALNAPLKHLIEVKKHLRYPKTRYEITAMPPSRGIRTIYSRLQDSRAQIANWGDFAVLVCRIFFSFAEPGNLIFLIDLTDFSPHIEVAGVIFLTAIEYHNGVNSLFRFESGRLYGGVYDNPLLQQYLEHFRDILAWMDTIPPSDSMSVD